MSRDRMLVLAACYLAILSVGENSTAIMAALPAMTSGLGLDPATVEWIVNAYLLASAVFIVLGGDAADRFGARRSSAAGIALFALASLVIALAADGAMVVGARALQGVGAAFAVAGTLAAVSEAASDSDRGRMIGAWTGFLMLGFSIGPLVGGAVTHTVGWRVNFWLNLAVMLPAALALWLNAGGEGKPARSNDWLGLGLLALFMVALVHGLRAMASAVANPLAAIAPLGLAAIAFAALFRVETRRERPLVDFALFRSLNFALACALAFLLMSDIMAVLLYYNLFAQSPEGLGRTPIAAGLSLMPMSAALFGFARARAVARGENRPQAHDGGRGAPHRARLRHRLGVGDGRGLRGAAHRPLRRRGRHRAPLRVGPEDRPRGADADRDRQGLRRPQFVQLSRRHCRRDRRRDRIRPRGV